MRRELSDNERIDWLRLIRSENVGAITFRRLIQRYGSAGEALRILPDLATKGGAKTSPRIGTLKDAEAEYASLQKFGAQFYASIEPAYPEALAAIEDAPPLIAMGRNADLAARPCIAIVGARNASLNGRKLAEMLARDLAEAGLTIVSGLARGIDTAAHQASLARGTIAVVAGGIDVTYPPENADLQKAIFESGALISEMPPGTQPTQRHFPRRNRIISGLARGVIIVEASPNSGSLITATQALEQGREVFAVPGSPLDPRAAGTNNLIRAGAHLITCAEDVLTVLRDMNAGMRQAEQAGFADVLTSAPDEAELETARLKVVECLSPSPTNIDELIRDSHLSPALVSAVLLEFELAGRIERQPGNKVSLI